MNEDPKRLTFALLDEKDGFPKLPPATGDEFPLPAWYRSVYNTPFGQFTVEDISKACRQDIHIDAIAPLAIAALEQDPLAGELYDGELLVALAGVPKRHWLNRAPDLLRLRIVIRRALRDPALDEETAEEIRYLRDRLG